MPRVDEPDSEVRHRRVPPLYEESRGEVSNSNRRRRERDISSEPRMAPFFQAVTQMREAQATIDAFLSQTDSQGPTRLMKTLFDLWANDYDNHMRDHEVAIGYLLRQAQALNTMKFGSREHDIIGRRLLNMSCGTGTDIKLLCDAIGAEAARNLLVTANDLSDRMKAKLLAKLEGVCHVALTGQDIRNMNFENKFDTIMFSQTLHLVVDPALLRAEKNPGRVEEKTDHREMKTNVIRQAFNMLDPGGHFILIDEWPPMLTQTSTDPVQAVVNPLFNYTFRPIAARGILRDKMMRNIPGARFVAELKARINKEHSMYIFIYARDEDKRENREKPLPSTATDAEKDGHSLKQIYKARQESVLRIQQGFVGIDPHFIAAYTPETSGRGGFSGFSPLGEGKAFYSEEHRVSELADLLSQKPKKYSSVMISQALHMMTDEQRMETITNAIASLRIGGALVFADEWPAPAGSENPLRKSIFRDAVMERFHRDMMFEGALRDTILPGYSSGIYGYMYRRMR